jgi:RNA polymerase sigma-70 factor (ECF subfamily)
MMAMMLDQDDDGFLIERARGGDRAAFGALVERHYDFVHRVAYRWCGNRADAEDIAQDVCVRIGRAIRDYRGGGAFTTWLYAMTLNAARDMKRKAAREGAKTSAFIADAALSPEAGQDSDLHDATEALWDAVRLLPGKQRDAVLLVYGEGLSHAAAADAMAISETTVSWHIHEAKKRLKVFLRPAGEE